MGGACSHNQKQERAAKSPLNFNQNATATSSNKSFKESCGRFRWNLLQKKG